MNKLSEWILSEAGDEEVVSVVIGAMGWGDYGSEEIPNYEEIPKGKVLPWSEAVKYLQYEFSAGFGAPGCQAITAWTANKVIFVSQYDGSTSIESVPRNPVDHMPNMPGG